MSASSSQVSYSSQGADACSMPGTPASTHDNSNAPGIAHSMAPEDEAASSDIDYLEAGDAAGSAHEALVGVVPTAILRPAIAISTIAQSPTAGDAAGSAQEALVGCLPRTKRKRRTKADMLVARAQPRHESKFGRVGQRTKEQHIASCAHARAAKASKSLARTKKEVMKYAEDLTLAVHSSSLREGHRLELRPTSARGLPDFRKQLVAIRRHLRKAKSKSQCPMSAETLVALSRSSLNAGKDVAKVYQCSPWQVRMARKVTAWSILNVQQELLRAMGTEGDLRFMVSSIAFDETSEKLDLDLPGMRQNLKLAWKVLVSLQDLAVQTREAGDVALVKTIRPPVALLSSRAEVVLQGLWGCVSVKALTDVFEEGLRRAAIAVVLHTDRDACAANDRVIANKHKMLPIATQAGGVVLASDLPCSNHQNQLVDVAVCNLFGMDLIGSVYRSALLFRMGSYWLRILQAVDVVVDSSLQIQTTSHEVSISGYNMEWASYLRANYRQSEARSRTKPRGHEQRPTNNADEPPRTGEAWRLTAGGRAWSTDLDNLMSLLPTPWHSDDLVHVHQVSHPAVDRASIVKKVVHAVRMVLFRNLPCVPCAGKWTRTGPAVDAILTSLLVHSLLPRVLQVAFSKSLAASTVTVTHRANNDEQSFIEELRWHEVASKRARLTQELAENRSKRLALVMFSIIKEPLRYLTARFLRAAARTQRRQDVADVPRLAEFTLLRSSPVLLVEQYISSMVHGLSSRLLLVTASTTLSEWKHRQGDAALSFRSACLLAACSLRRRFSLFQQFPWALCSLVDPRCTQDERSRVADLFVGMPPCQLDPMFSQRLQAKVLAHPTPSLHLLGEPWTSILRAWARTVLDGKHVTVRQLRLRGCYVAVVAVEVQQGAVLLLLVVVASVMVLVVVAAEILADEL